jgi:diguanylate cyclase (GGDEF)-like protein
MRLLRAREGWTPLARARTGALTFSLMATGPTLLQMDHTLPTYRILIAYSAVISLIVQFLVIYQRKSVGWPSTITSAFLVVLGAQALAVEPTTVSIAMAVLTGQSFYGSARMAVVRALLVTAAIPAAMALGALLDSKTFQPSLIILPIPLLSMFGLLLRTLFNALQRQELAARRESLLARTGRALLGVTDRSVAQAIVRKATVELREIAPGLILEDESIQEAEELVPFRFKSPLPKEIRDVLNALEAQLSLVLTICSAHAELLNMAHNDPLTGIYNRAAFFDVLTDAVDAMVGTEARVALLIVDLDDFKTINDTLGHAAGDQVLVEVARRLTVAVDGRGAAARFGGDEFALLLFDVPSPEIFDALAENLSNSLVESVKWQGTTLLVGASIGLVNGAPGLTGADLMRCADIAMYSAKEQGKNHVVRFSDAEHGSIANLLLLEKHLPQALDRREIEVRYEPIIELATGRCIGVQAHAFWNHPKLGALPPGSFVPLAERMGYIVELGRFVLDTACAQVQAWSPPVGAAPLNVSVRICYRQLAADLVEVVRNALRSSHLPAQRLMLEFTEADALGNRIEWDGLAAVHNLGVQLALDSFGTGAASLSPLHSLAVNQVKLDRGLLNGDDKKSRELVSTIVAVSNLLGLETVAKSVDTREDCLHAQNQGISLAQGALFSVPLRGHEMSAWLDANGWPVQTGVQIMIQPAGR